MRARVGDAVRVLHIGQGGGDEEGWLYVSTPRSRRGWLPSAYVEPHRDAVAKPTATPGAAPSTERRSPRTGVLWTAVVQQRVPSEGPGYIAVREGDVVEVLHTAPGWRMDGSTCAAARGARCAQRGGCPGAPPSRRAGSAAQRCQPSESAPPWRPRPGAVTKCPAAVGGRSVPLLRPTALDVRGQARRKRLASRGQT
ncbi:unnamed protein product [Prorocentrum cordatum]|uniref:SH3 domain-containing protein n=1 Tax=Prorocentrum cordatum TaxID=2364126 RepID=A0ABN9XYB7_9DINO|nr:unnamed protein product [Polarella glacialis]